MVTQEGYVTEIARLFPRQGKWREEDYFALPESSQIIELKDGVISVSPAPDDKHQSAVVQLVTALNTFVREHNLGLVRVAPYDVRLSEGLIRQPDVVFLRAAHQDRISGGLLDGPPDWVAEVISPGSRKTDEVEKMSDYAQAGIPEYWLLDPEAKTIRVYVLHGESYMLSGTHGVGQAAASETIDGFQVEVASIFSL